MHLLGSRAAVPDRVAGLVFIRLGAAGSLHLVPDISGLVHEATVGPPHALVALSN